MDTFADPEAAATALLAAALALCAVTVAFAALAIAFCVKELRAWATLRHPDE